MTPDQALTEVVLAALGIACVCVAVAVAIIRADRRDRERVGKLRAWGGEETNNVVRLRK